MMDSGLLKNFTAFRRLKVNYNGTDFQHSYAEAIPLSVFEKALAYKDARRMESELSSQGVTEPYQGAFHLVLNVKVDADSPFIPFAYVTNSDVAEEKAAKRILKEIKGKIKYNFTNLLDTLSVDLQQVVEAVSFKVCVKNNEIQISDIKVSGREAPSIVKQSIERISREKGNFIEVLSGAYAEKGVAGELYYEILSFDFDSKSGHKLTQFLIISENPTESWYFTQVRVRTLRDIVSIIRTRYIDDIAQKNLYESIKSAVSAIMCRNLSHNLGSHYLYYTKVSLEKLANESGNFGPQIRGAAKVLSYIQSRMDYLATIVSNDKYPYGSVNFKSQILDELTVDDFSKRHYGMNQDAEFKNKIEDNLLELETVGDIVSELATLYSECENLTGEEFTKKRKIIDAKLSSLRMEIAYIDTNSIYNRTTNYLLTNLIKSENYSRPNILGLPETESFRNLFLYVRLWNDETKQFDLFTGSNETSEMAKESPLKDKLSKINLALPGGTMSCHAFYNILENFIRNSAKYSWTDYRPKELKVTIALKVDNDQHLVECTMYDNKHDALRYRDSRHKRTLLEDIVYRLSHTRVLADNHMIDKENKGLKEMLFSAVWLKANESDKTFAEIITSMEGLKPKNKLVQISKHAFEFVSVDDDGLICDDFNRANLGLRFVLPLFTHVEQIQGKTINDFIKLHTDVVEVENPAVTIPQLKRSYSKVFPRVYSRTTFLDSSIDDVKTLVDVSVPSVEAENVVKLKQSIINNLGDIDQYALKFASVTEPGPHKDVSTENLVFFDTHFSTKASKSRLKEYYGRFAYVDTISGNNFTKTLQGLFLSGLTNGNCKYKTFGDFYLALKIKESGLTRITIIDERLFNSVRWGDDVEASLNNEHIPEDYVLDIRSTGAELSMKNIRVLNFLNGKESSRKGKCFHKVDGLPFLFGNKFFSLGPCKDMPNSTHFLSIHLGLIEKLLKSKKLEPYIGERGSKPLSELRIKNLMSLLESQFGAGIENGVHICVHSGRGNFSKELEGPLKNYPFLSLAALENAFNNSKYLLAQLFYNTIYIGKGEVNH